MNTPPASPENHGNGDVSVVLIQHLASMVGEYHPRAIRAEEIAGRAQHQVHVLMREVDRLESELDHSRAVIRHMDMSLIQIIALAQHIIAGIPDIDNEDTRVVGFNHLINEYNRNHPIDLTADSDIDED